MDPLSNPGFMNDYIFYIKVQSATIPDFSWEGYSHLDNCNFLKEAVNAVHNFHSSYLETILWNQL